MPEKKTMTDFATWNKVNFTVGLFVQQYICIGNVVPTG
jgi:hypothetical protein